MKTNFFEQVAGLGINGTLQVNIQPNESGTLTISVLLATASPKISQGKNIPPMLLKGSPQELDEAFFDQINEPVKQTVKLFANLETYQRELEKANETAQSKKKSETGKASSKKTDNENEELNEEEEDNSGLFRSAPDDKQAKAEKRRLYDEAIERVTDLNSQMKYAEAIAQLPEVAEYPEKADELNKKREQLESRKKMYENLQQEV